jgi:hypothetical protein
MANVELASRRLGELVLATRDLSLALDGELSQHSVELGAHDGQIVLGVKPELLFDANADMVAAGADSVLAAVGKVSAAHPTLHVVLREPAGAVASVRLRRLGDALRARGVAESRLVLPASRAEEPPSAPASNETGDGSAASAETKPPAPPAPVKVPVEPGPTGYEIAFSP